MLAELFKGSDTIEMDNENHARFSAAGSALQEGLEAAYKGVSFRRNLSWAWAGLGLLARVDGARGCQPSRYPTPLRHTASACWP